MILKLSGVSDSGGNPAGNNTTVRPILDKNDDTERNEEIEEDRPVCANTLGSPGRPPRQGPKKTSLNGSIKHGSIHSGHKALSPVRIVYEAPITSCAQPETLSNTKDPPSETPQRDPLILQIELEESSMFPKKKLSLIFACFIISILTSLLMGNKTVPSIIGIKKCSTPFFSIAVIYTIVLVSISFIVSKIIQDEMSRKKVAGCEFSDRDNWTTNRILK
jgi:hypothetical protein